MSEFHPIVWIFDYQDNKTVMRYKYNQKEVIYEEYSGTYADINDEMITKEYGWDHSLGDVVTALTSEGLQVEFLKEYGECPYNVLPRFRRNRKRNVCNKR